MTCAGDSSPRAVVLAGGRGTRLRPFTVSFPKPLMPIGDQPILEIIVRQLAAHGFGRITLAVNHQAELLKAFFGDGERWGVRIDYSLEYEPLGTMGPLRLIDDLPDDILVMNGDILSDIAYGALLARHKAEGRLFTIATARREQFIDYGVLDLLGAGEPIVAEPHGGYWLDIGRPDDYAQATEDWPALKVRLGL